MCCERGARLEQQAIDQRMRVVTEITTELERSQAGRREDNEHFQKCLSRLQKETAERCVVRSLVPTVTVSI